MRGFTMLELLMGLAISALLAAVAVPSYQAYAERARVGEAISDLSRLDMQIEHFFADNFRYPDTLAQLPPGPREDPWGNPYVYLRIDGNPGPGIQGQVRKDQALNPINSDYDLFSSGEDGDWKKPLTAKASRDDIVRAGNGGFIGLAEDF